MRGSREVKALGRREAEDQSPWGPGRTDIWAEGAGGGQVGGRIDGRRVGDHSAGPRKPESQLGFVHMQKWMHTTYSFKRIFTIHITIN